MEISVQERVIKEASTLFLLKGIKSVTMDMIASKVGISKRTLYENFQDKDSLLIASITYHCEQENKRYMELAKMCDNSIEILLVVYKDILEKMRYTNRNYFSDLTRYHPAVAEYFNSKRKIRHDNSISLLKKGIDEGYVRSDLKVEIVTVLLDSQFELIAKSDSILMMQYSFEEIFETVFMNFVRGVATSKGVKLIDEFVENKLKK